MRKALLAIALGAMIFASPIHAMEVEDIGIEYYEPTLMETTAYICGTHTADGTPVREGLCAMKREWIGKTAIVYSAIKTEDGYKVGGLLGVFEVKDTGFGKDMGDGTGTIEAGKHIDIYKTNLNRAQDWMNATQGKCFVQVVNAVG